MLTRGLEGDAGLSLLWEAGAAGVCGQWLPLTPCSLSIRHLPYMQVVGICRHWVSILTSSWRVPYAPGPRDLSSPSGHAWSPLSVGSNGSRWCWLSSATSFPLAFRGSETTAMYFCILRCQSKMKSCRQERKVTGKSCRFGEGEKPTFALWELLTAFQRVIKRVLD